MAKLKITQVKSAIDSNVRQKATLEALGLKKNNQTVEKDKIPQVEGMVRKVKHLVKVEEI